MLLFDSWILRHQCRGTAERIIGEADAGLAQQTRVWEQTTCCPDTRRRRNARSPKFTTLLPDVEKYGLRLSSHLLPRAL